MDRHDFWILVLVIGDVWLYPMWMKRFMMIILGGSIVERVVYKQMKSARTRPGNLLYQMVRPLTVPSTTIAIPLPNSLRDMIFLYPVYTHDTPCCSHKWKLCGLLKTSLCTKYNSYVSLHSLCSTDMRPI